MPTLVNDLASLAGIDCAIEGLARRTCAMIPTPAQGPFRSPPAGIFMAPWPWVCMEQKRRCLYREEERHELQSLWREDVRMRQGRQVQLREGLQVREEVPGLQVVAG